MIAKMMNHVLVSVISSTLLCNGIDDVTYPYLVIFSAYHILF